VLIDVPDDDDDDDDDDGDGDDDEEDMTHLYTSSVHCPSCLSRNFFSKLDLNRDGKISFQEFRACLVGTGDGSWWKWLWVDKKRSECQIH